MENNKEKTIRKIESEILDNEFKNYALVNYSNQISVPHLLKVYGDLTRDLESEKYSNRSDFALWKVLNQFLEGLTHCLKWVVNHPGTKSGDKLSFEEKDQMALDFLIWGKEYQSVAQLYVAWSRKLIEVELDSVKSEISFLPVPKIETYFGLSQDISSKKIMDEYLSSFPYKKLNDYFSIWVKEINISQYPIEIDWAKVKTSSVLEDIKIFFSLNMIPELDSKTNLIGYTLGDFIHFYSCLFINFEFITAIENHIDSKTNLENIFGSTPLSISKKKVTSFFMKVTGLSQDIVYNILKDITLDMKKFHSKIICQPIIETKESFYLLPRIFNRIFPKNLIPNILTKGTKGDLYSKLINRIEKENLSKNEHLINTLKKFQFDLILEKSFSTGKKIVTPDFLLIDNINKEIMIIDYKHFLSPFSAADTSNRLKELQKGVKQLRKYLHFFSTYKDKELSNIKDYKHYGMLLFHNPMVMPVKLPKEGNIVFSDENTFYQYLPKVKSLTELNNTIKELPDLSIKIESCTYLPMELKVQNIKFKWPLFVVE